MSHMNGFMAKSRGGKLTTSAKATKKGKQAKSVAPQGKNLLNGKVDEKMVQPSDKK